MANTTLFRRQNRDPLVLKALPVTANLYHESSTLADKLASRIEWMKNTGIAGSLTASGHPPPARKSPLPGTVIYFSSAALSQDVLTSVGAPLRR